MASETITVVYQPIGGTGGRAFHETLLYTNSEGKQFFATAFPSVDPPGNATSPWLDPLGNSDQLVDVGEGYVAVETGTASVYGNLTVRTGPVESLSYEDNRRLFGNAYQEYDNQDLAVGSDLKANWYAIVA